MRRNQTSIRRLFPTSSSSSTSFSSPSFSASASTCYSPLTFSPVPNSVEKEKLNDNVTPFNSCELEKSNKLKVKKVVKKEKERKKEVEMIRCDNVYDNVKDRDNHKNDDNNEYSDNRNDRNDDNDDSNDSNDNRMEERCNDQKHISVHKQLSHNVNRNRSNDWNIIEEEDEDEDDVRNSGNNKFRSKNKKDSTHGNEYEIVKENEYTHKRKGRGDDKDKKRKEGTIMEWSAIGALNWDIMFLLGGGFALSEGFQVR